MSAKVNIVGKTFGRWTVLSLDENSLGKKNRNYTCRCECGTVKSVGRPNLITGGSISCGCYWLECMRVGEGEAGFRRVLEHYRRSAKDRGIPFLLSDSQVRKITKMMCHYCGTSPNQVSCSTQSRRDPVAFEYAKYVYNGIDRKDNTGSYELSNVVPCCFQCNRSKNSLTYEEFTAWLDKIYTFKRTCNENISDSLSEK